MLKYLTSLILAAATVAVALKEFAVLPSGVSLDVLEVMAQDFRVTEKMANHRQFRFVFDSTLEYLASGDIRLRPAVSRVRHAGEAFCPTFIRLVPLAERSKSLNESLARNLLSHIRMRSENQGRQLPQIAQLEAELQEIIAEPEAQASIDITDSRDNSWMRQFGS